MMDAAVTAQSIGSSNPYYRLVSYRPQIPTHLDARSNTQIELAILTLSLFVMGMTTCIVALLIMLGIF